MVIESLLMLISMTVALLMLLCMLTGYCLGLMAEQMARDSMWVA